MAVLNRVTSGKLYSALAGISDKPVINIQSYHKLNHGYYSSVFTTAAQQTKHFTFRDYDATIAELSAEKFGIVAGSLYSVEDAHLPMFRCVLFAKTESKPFDEDHIKGMKVTVANQFADDDDNIWRVIGEGENRRLVQISEDDFDKILESRRERNPVVASYNRDVPYEDGDYVCFFNSAKADMDFGFVLASDTDDRDYVFSRSQEALVSIIPPQVMEAAVLNEYDGKKSPSRWKYKAIAAEEFNKDRFLDYMRSLYGGTDFFRALESKIRDSSTR